MLFETCDLLFAGLLRFVEFSLVNWELINSDNFSPFCIPDQYFKTETTKLSFSLASRLTMCLSKSKDGSSRLSNSNKLVRASACSVTKRKRVRLGEWIKERERERERERKKWKIS